MRHSVSDLTAVIRDRRTIQPNDMSDRVVQRDMVELILSNATWAPNHGMTQPWRFVVFAGDARHRLSAFMGEEYTRITPPEKFMPRKHENAVQRPLQASVVVALGMARDPRGKISELEEQLAVACAVQNMHLTCTAYGLGGFWGTGAVVTGDGMRRFIGLAEGDRCMGLFYMGYPAVDWPKGYRKPLPDVMSWQQA
ncbi:MAG TPA: nitroreductase [Flavobacteriales bacterium]|mgnify:CR=1 FL=1|nr:nitroreductase [Flavobacteriales bacterium]HMR27801.1 nitroreductase [Flavobacteriales bacterium]